MPPPAALPDPIAEAFRSQVRACAAMGSPFNAALLDGLPARLDPGSAFGARILGWTGDAKADALPLRAAGALHALARSGLDPALSAAWPPDPQGDPVEAAAAAIARHDAWLTPWLDGPPQTNETARSAVLLGGALHAAARLRMPLEVLEIGASAGLNLAFDRYRYALGEGLAWGDPASPVRVESEWRGPPPPLDAPLEIVSRAACDLSPLDPGDPQARARLTAYIWPDQAARLARLEAALTLAAAAPWRVERADAAEWLEARLARPQTPGTARLVMHSIMRQYLPAATAARIDAAIAAAGDASAANAPLAHLSMEPDGAANGAAVTLTLRPEGGRREIGRCDFHARWAEWADAPA